MRYANPLQLEITRRLLVRRHRADWREVLQQAGQRVPYPHADVPHALHGGLAAVRIRREIQGYFGL
jgi:hypothetical protein